MDWDKLRIFHAVASAGSFTHAGQMLALSQSAVSRQISALEEEINTPLFQRQPDRMKEALTRAIPFRRIAQSIEIAQAVLFFLSRRSDYITGQVLSVSGGLTMVD